MSHKLVICDGKYTFILPDNDYRIKVLRYDEEWLWIEAGSKAVGSLVIKHIEAQQALADIGSHHTTKQSEMELAKMNYEAWAVEKRQALAEKDRQLAAANARNEMLKAENNRLCVEGHEYQAIAENANASLAKEIATLKEQVRVLTASAKGDRVCMWCRQVLEPVPGNEIETAARLADHLLHCKDHPLAKLLNTQGLWVGELQEENATLKTLLRETNDAQMHRGCCDHWRIPPRPCNCNFTRIHDALSQPPSAPTLGELHAAEQEGKDVTL